MNQCCLRVWLLGETNTTVVMHARIVSWCGDLPVDTETCNYRQRAVGSAENLEAITQGEASLTLLNLCCSEYTPEEDRGENGLSGHSGGANTLSLYLSRFFSCAPGALLRAANSVKIILSQLFNSCKFVNLLWFNNDPKTCSFYLSTFKNLYLHTSRGVKYFLHKYLHFYWSTVSERLLVTPLLMQFSIKASCGSTAPIMSGSYICYQWKLHTENLEHYAGLTLSRHLSTNWTFRDFFPLWDGSVINSLSGLMSD